MNKVPDRSFLLAVILLLFCSACVFVTTDSELRNSAEVQQDLRQLSDIRAAFVRAMTHGGLDEWVRIPPGLWRGRHAPGRTTISSSEEVSIWVRRLLEEHQVHHFALTTEEIVAGNWAFVWGVYLLESTPGAGEAEQGQRGKILSVWKRKPEGWKGAYVSFNSDGYWP